MTQAIERREAAVARCSVATADEAGMAGESLTELVLLLKSWRERANAKTDTDHTTRANAHVPSHEEKPLHCWQKMYEGRGWRISRIEMK